MSRQKRVYTKGVSVLRTIESRKLNENERCNLLKRRDSFYQVIFKKGKENFYLVDNISQYDQRAVEDAFYRIRTLEDFFRERDDLVLRPDEDDDRTGYLEEDLEDIDEQDPFRDAEEMLNPDDEE